MFLYLQTLMFFQAKLGKLLGDLCRLRLRQPTAHKDANLADGSGCLAMPMQCRAPLRGHSRQQPERPAPRRFLDAGFCIEVSWVFDAGDDPRSPAAGQAY